MPPFFHFGFHLANPARVRELLMRITADVVVVEEVQEPSLVSFKCLDPDGYVVEVY